MKSRSIVNVNRTGVGIKANAAPKWVSMRNAPESLRKQAELTSRQNEPSRWTVNYE